MLYSRPLLYMSLPGVAFILGVFWFRRRNKNRNAITSDLNSETKDTNLKDNEINEELIQKLNVSGAGAGADAWNANANRATTRSMNINGNCNSDNSFDDNTVTKLFGKSAPIKIVQNGRCSPIKIAQQQQQQIDSEVLKTKIQDVEQKTLRSIEEDFENLSSSVDLPDSLNSRHVFYARNVTVTKDEPVVIKATRTPKISPENSFLESKYTKECEQNNNCALYDNDDDADDDAIDIDDDNNRFSNKVNKNETKNINIKTPNNQNNSAIISSKNDVIVITDKLVENDELTEIVNSNKLAVANVNVVADLDANSSEEKRSVDVASPSLSLCSEQSGDSGKGSSLPRSEAVRAKTTYEFLFPSSLVGHLYGRKKAYITEIMTKTMTNITLRKNRYTPKVRICVIEGTESQINAALIMIRQRLPAKNYPNFTMQRIHFALPQTVVPLSNDSLLNLQLNLIEGINNDVIVTAVVNGGHIFVQHPLHPSHPSLALLQKRLYESYTGIETPLLPNVEINAVCVIPVNNIWYRVQIMEKDSEDEQRCVIKFLDFGGYMNVHFHELRQIRSDFMGIPFQATECILSNIEPNDSVWQPEASDVLCKLTKGIVLQAQVAGYNSLNVPEIYLFACLGPNNFIFINKELVARNLAQWVEFQD